MTTTLSILAICAGSLLIALGIGRILYAVRRMSGTDAPDDTGELHPDDFTAGMQRHIEMLRRQGQ